MTDANCDQVIEKLDELRLSSSNILITPNEEKRKIVIECTERKVSLKLKMHPVPQLIDDR